MISRLFYLLALNFVVDAVDQRDVFKNYSILQKCKPTLSMFDASGKFPNGIKSGNLIDIGNFDQCLGIEEYNNKSEIIHGKYCFIKISLPNPEEDSRIPFKMFWSNFLDIPELKNILKIEERMTLQSFDNSAGLILGWCVPHTCPINELSSVLSTILQVFNRKIKIAPVMDGMCQTKNDLKTEYNAESIILITFLVATLCLMIMSTLYDIYIQHHKMNPAHIILIAFSVKTNGHKLLSISNNPDQLPCLNGIRFISMLWVVYAHRLSTSFYEPLTNLNMLASLKNDPANMYMLNASLSVDTFFVLSGVLLAYGYCLARDKGLKFNIIVFYLHRYLRLTPVLAVIIWIHATILGYFGSGPFWPLTISSLQNYCVDYWWSALLYVQNYYNTQEMCIGQSWYLSVDMQLYILSPIILIPLWKWPKHTLIASAVLVLGSVASSFTITYVKELSGSFMAGASAEYLANYYMTTHTRFGPWLMGLMLGYYLFKLKKDKTTRITMHPAEVAFGWIVGMGLLVSSLFAGHNLILHRNRLGDSFYNGFDRHGWALGLCWIIYACTQGYGGPINTFLSWSLFQILGRFTYTIYLVHVSLQYLIMGSLRTSNYFTQFMAMYKFWGDFMFSLAISVCLTLAYESPMVTIEKVLFKKGQNPKEPEVHVHQKPSTFKGGETNNGFVEDK